MSPISDHPGCFVRTNEKDPCQSYQNCHTTCGILCPKNYNHYVDPPCLEWCVEEGNRNCSDFYPSNQWIPPPGTSSTTTTSAPSHHQSSDDYNYDYKNMVILTIVSVLVLILLIYCIVGCRARRFLENHPCPDGAWWRLLGSWCCTVSFYFFIHRDEWWPNGGWTDWREVFRGMWNTFVNFLDECIGRGNNHNNNGQHGPPPPPPSPPHPSGGSSAVLIVDNFGQESKPSALFQRDVPQAQLYKTPPPHNEVYDVPRSQHSKQQQQVPVVNQPGTTLINENCDGVWSTNRGNHSSHAHTTQGRRGQGDPTPTRPGAPSSTFVRGPTVQQQRDQHAASLRSAARHEMLNRQAEELANLLQRRTDEDRHVRFDNDIRAFDQRLEAVEAESARLREAQRAVNRAQQDAQDAQDRERKAREKAEKQAEEDRRREHAQQEAADAERAEKQAAEELLRAEEDQRRREHAQLEHEKRAQQAADAERAEKQAAEELLHVEDQRQQSLNELEESLRQMHAESQALDRQMGTTVDVEDIFHSMTGEVTLEELEKRAGEDERHREEHRLEEQERVRAEETEAAAQREREDQVRVAEEQREHEERVRAAKEAEAAAAQREHEEQVRAADEAKAAQREQERIRAAADDARLLQEQAEAALLQEQVARVENDEATDPPPASDDHVYDSVDDGSPPQSPRAPPQQSITTLPPSATSSTVEPPVASMLGGFNVAWGGSGPSKPTQILSALPPAAVLNGTGTFSSLEQVNSEAIAGVRWLRSSNPVRPALSDAWYESVVLLPSGPPQQSITTPPSATSTPVPSGAGTLNGFADTPVAAIIPRITRRDGGREGNAQAARHATIGAGAQYPIRPLLYRPRQIVVEDSPPVAPEPPKVSRYGRELRQPQTFQPEAAPTRRRQAPPPPKEK